MFKKTLSSKAITWSYTTFYDIRRKGPLWKSFQDILAYLSSVGHTLEEQGAAESIVCGIEKVGYIIECCAEGGIHSSQTNSIKRMSLIKGDDGRIYANSDYRKDGGVAGYWRMSDLKSKFVISKSRNYVK